MITYPANEQTISQVERGLSCEAIVPLAQGLSLVAGETILFAHSRARPGQAPAYVKGGDSVLVQLTGVTDLGAIDPDTGQMLVQVRWVPLGQEAPSTAATKRISKSFGSSGRA